MSSEKHIFIIVLGLVLELLLELDISALLAASTYCNRVELACSGESYEQFRTMSRRYRHTYFRLLIGLLLLSLERTLKEGSYVV